MDGSLSGVHLLPKLRGYFAEFLNHDSLVRLSMLYLTTCVGLGTGGFDPHVEAFLDKTGSPLNPTKGIPITPHLSRSRVYLGTGHTLRHTQPPVCSSYHFVSPLLTRSPYPRSPKRPNTNPTNHHKSGMKNSCPAVKTHC